MKIPGVAITVLCPPVPVEFYKAVTAHYGVKHTFSVESVGCGMDSSCWSKLAMLGCNAGRLQASSGRGDPGCSVHHRAAVPRVSCPVPRLTTEQSSVDVTGPCGTEVRTAALLGVGAEVAQDAVDRRHLANGQRNSSIYTAAALHPNLTNNKKAALLGTGP